MSTDVYITFSEKPFEDMVIHPKLYHERIGHLGCFVIDDNYALFDCWRAYLNSKDNNLDSIMRVYKMLYTNAVDSDEVFYKDMLEPDKLRQLLYVHKTSGKPFMYVRID
jgi:hypothetical protein